MFLAELVNLAYEDRVNIVQACNVSGVFAEETIEKHAQLNYALSVLFLY